MKHNVLIILNFVLLVDFKIFGEMGSQSCFSPEWSFVVQSTFYRDSRAKTQLLGTVQSSFQVQSFPTAA